MANPLFQMMGGGMPPIVQQFMKFKQTFSGDAQAQVQELLNSGKVTQEQYNQAVQQARALEQLLSASGRR